MRGNVFIAVVLLGALALVSGFAWWVWSELGDVAIGMHGMIALIAGVVVTFGLGAGLMALVFYSNRRGFDDDAGGG